MIVVFSAHYTITLAALVDACNLDEKQGIICASNSLDFTVYCYEKTVECIPNESSEIFIALKV